MKRPALRLLAAVTMCLLLAVVVGWYADGGRWYVVRTPSMGTVAPVGTLLWVHPVDPGDLHAGDVITFRPPGRLDTYSHRITSIAPDGTLTTKGDITAPDPWRLTSSDVLGKVEARWWGVGWVVRALPLLAIAAALTVLAARFVRPGRRPVVLLLGASVAVAVALLVFRPLTGAVRLGGSDGVANYVATGALPVRVEAGDTTAVLKPGQTLTVRAQGGRTDVELSPEFAWWGWVLLVGGCLLPAGATTVREASQPRPARRHGR